MLTLLCLFFFTFVRFVENWEKTKLVFFLNECCDYSEIYIFLLTVESFLALNFHPDMFCDV